MLLVWFSPPQFFFWKRELLCLSHTHCQILREIRAKMKRPSKVMSFWAEFFNEISFCCEFGQHSFCLRGQIYLTIISFQRVLYYLIREFVSFCHINEGVEVNATLLFHEGSLNAFTLQDWSCGLWEENVLFGWWAEKINCSNRLSTYCSTVTNISGNLDKPLNYWPEELGC